MFEDHSSESPTSVVWKVLPGLALFLLLVLIGIFLWRPTDEPSESSLEGVIRADSKAFARQALSVDMEDRGIKMLKNFAGHRMVMFAGEVANRGDRPLDVLEVKLVLYNESDPVFEAVRTPIRPGPYTPAVPPGEKRGFTIYLEDFPSEWMASRAEMHLNGFRFAGVTAETGRF